MCIHAYVHTYIQHADSKFSHLSYPTVEVVVKFNPDTYLVKEGEDDNAVIQLEAMGEHGFEFTVLVRSMDGSARSK